MNVSETELQQNRLSVNQSGRLILETLQKDSLRRSSALKPQRIVHKQASTVIVFCQVTLSNFGDAAGTLVSYSSEELLKKEFAKLVIQWRSETRGSSSVSDLFTHPAYQRIMGMGMVAVPWVLKELESFPARWFYALKFMVGLDASEGATSFREAREKWLEWGRQHKKL